MQLRDGLCDALNQWCRQGYPNEVVALLLGTIDAADEIVIAQFVPVANVAIDTTRHFVLDPQGWLTADAQAQVLGLEIVGIVHTHPNAVPQPSASDSASAALLGTRFAYLIASVHADGAVDMHGWRWDGRAFRLQRLLCH
jgi:proteasome lid subunit RPN8/RPN11